MVSMTAGHGDVRPRLSLLVLSRFDGDGSGPEWHGHSLRAYYLIEEAAAVRLVHSAAT